MYQQELFKNTSSHHNNIHAFVVSGGGGGMEYSILTRLIARSLSERQIPYTSILNTEPRKQILPIDVNDILPK